MARLEDDAASALVEKHAHVKYRAAHVKLCTRRAQPAAARNTNMNIEPGQAGKAHAMPMPMAGIRCLRLSLMWRG